MSLVQLTIVQARDEVLRLLYAHSNSPDKRIFLTAEEISEIGDSMVSPSKIVAVMEDLTSIKIQYCQASALQNSWRLTRRGFLYVESELISGEVIFSIPASDRIVTINHNQPDYIKIHEGLTEIKEAVRGLNDSGLDSEERDRIAASLSAAEALWGATQLKVLQIKVGVLLAAEDAAQALASTAKAVAAALLVDAIKSFMKTQFGIDLDQL